MSARIGRRQSSRRLAVSLTLCAGMLVLEGCGASESADRAAPMDVIEPGLVVGTPVRLRSEWTVSDSFALFRPADIALVRGRILVGDSGNDRLVLFDMDLVPLRTIGRPGPGPGELRQPFRIRARNGFLVASELGNPRYSFFHEDGSFSHAIPREGLEGVFDLTADGTLYRASAHDSYYLLRIGNSGDTSSVAAIPDEVRALRRAGSPRPRWRSDLVVVTGGDTLHVFDNEIGALVKFDTAGLVHAVRTLPEALRQQVIQQSEEGLRSLSDAGHRVLSYPLAAHLSVTDEGDLFLLLHSDRIVGLLIDPHSYAARYVRVPDDTAVWNPAAISIMAAVGDSTLYTLGREGLGSLRLREESP